MPYTRYKAADGKVVPSVTTLTKNLGWAQRGLMYWANTQGLAGKSLDEARGAAETGTAAHAMIEADISGDPIDTSRLEPEMLKRCEAILDRWREWKKHHVEEVYISERPMVSEVHRYGGRLDMAFLGTNGKTWLLDVKTGGVYADALVQVAGYAMMVEELTSHRIDEVAILRIPQDSDGIAVTEIPWDSKAARVASETFLACVQLHEAAKILKKAV